MEPFSKYTVLLDGRRVDNLNKDASSMISRLMEYSNSLIVVKNNSETNYCPRESSLEMLGIMNTLRSLEAAIAELAERYDSQKQVSMDISPLAAVFERDIKLINSNIELLKHDISTKIDNFDPLHTGKSVNQGALGQNLVINMLEDLDMNLSVTDVSQTSHVCDIHVIDPDYSLMYPIEVKNYTATIPGAEIEKFKKDMINLRSDPSYQNYTLIGLFLTTTKSIPKKGELYIDDDGDMYLSKKYLNKDVLQLLFTYYRQLYKNKTGEKNIPKESTSSEERDMSLYKDIYDLLQSITAHRKLIHANLKSAQTILKNCEIMEKSIDAADLMSIKLGYAKLDERCIGGIRVVKGESAKEQDASDKTPVKKAGGRKKLTL